MGAFEEGCSNVLVEKVAAGTDTPFWRKEDPRLDNGLVTRGGMFEHQRQWWELKNFIKLLVGGYGCVDGATEVAGEPIAERRDVSPIETLEGQAFASAGRLRGRAELYRVSTRLGREVVVTLAHRFLTPLGWRRLSELAVGVVIGGSASVDDEVELGRLSGSLAGCYGDARLHGAQLRRAAMLGLGSTSRSSLPNSSYLDGADARRARMGYAPSASQRSLVGALSLRSASEPDVSFHPTRLASSQVECYRRLGGIEGLLASAQYEFEVDGLGFDLSLDGYDDQYTEAVVSPYPPTIPVWDVIAKIEFVRFGDFYDLTVPGPDHYFAHGLWHHNCGKTSVLAKRAISTALHNAPCPVATVSPTFPLARQTIIPTIANYLEGKRGLYGRAFVWKYHKAFHEYRIRFHGREATIYCNSGENPDALRGPNLAAAYIDEPFIQKKAVFLQMLARVRHPDATFKEICLTGTPESLNWGYDLAIGEDKDNQDVGVVTASTRLNLALDKEYVERLMSAFDEKTAKAYIEGQFVNLSSGQVYHAFDPVQHAVEMEMPEGAELGAGMDFNVNPMAVCVFWVFRGHMHVFAEHQFPNADTEYVSQVLKEKYPKLKYVYPDASGSARRTSSPTGKTDFWYLQQGGFQIRAPYANPKLRDRFNAVNGRFKPAILSVDGTTTKRNLLTISKKSCPDLRKFLASYTYELQNKQKAMSHLLDAFGYPVCFLFGVGRDTLHQTRLGGT